MNYAAFLARRLSQSSCVIAGTKLGSQRDKLKTDRVKLSATIEAAIQAVLEKTRALQALPSTDASMNEVDRGTDRCVAASHDQLDAIERSFDHGAILPLTDKQSARLADATLVRAALMPAGTSFLRLVYSQQWVRMSAMIKALDQPETAAAVKRLGLTLEAERMRAWVELYGAKLGVTETRDADPAAVAVEAWHEAYGELIVRAHAEYDNAKDDAHLALRDALTSPYTTQADAERLAEQKARARRKASEPVEPTEG